MPSPGSSDRNHSYWGYWGPRSPKDSEDKEKLPLIWKMKFSSICGYLIGWGLLILCWHCAWTLGEVHAVITHCLNLKCGKESPQKSRLNEGLIYGEVRCRWAPNVRFTCSKKHQKSIHEGFTSKWVWLRLPPNLGDLKPLDIFKSNIQRLSDPPANFTHR